MRIDQPADDVTFPQLAHGSILMGCYVAVIPAGDDASFGNRRTAVGEGFEPACFPKKDFSECGKWPP